MKCFAKLFLVSAVIASASAGFVSAETVSQKEAAKLASAFFNAANGQVMASPKLVYNGRRLTTGRLFSPFYVYNLPTGGFVVISAENKAFPILGYSLRDSFDPDRMGDNLKTLLTSYARDIERIRYDSRVPDEAIEAWRDYPAYVSGLLKETYSADDPAFSLSEAADKIESILISDEAERFSSDIYTPEQWSGLIGTELKSKGSVAVGIYDEKNMANAIIHGRKGDYWRMELDSRDSSLWRLFATEFLSDGQIAAMGYAPQLKKTPEERPFIFYEAFVAESKAEAEKRARGLRPENISGQPVITGLGGGRFAIDLPEEIVLARVYSISGALVEQRQYKGTQTAHIDLAAQPQGFYFALIYGDNGKPFGVKLWR